MKARPRRYSQILAALALLGLGGCAADALKLAAPSPDQPWSPEQKTSTVNKTTKPQTTDYGVPSNPALAQFSGPVSVDNQRSYGLAELIDLAQRSNPSTRIAWEQSRQAALAVGMTEALMLPVITANVIGGRQKLTIPVDVPFIGERDITTKANNTTPFLAFVWLAFDFGQRAALTEAAGHVSFAANVAYNGMHQKIIFDVTRRYYEYSAAQAGYRIATQTLRNSKAILAATQAKHKEGLATTVELALARQQVAQSELRVVTAQGQEQNTYQALLSSMGVNATVTIKVDGSLNRRLPANFSGVSQSALEAALARRPDLQASYSAIEAGKAGVKVAQAEFLPKVFIAGTLASNRGGFNVGNLPNIGTQSSQKGIYLAATMPIFDGGLRAAQLKNAESVVGAASETFRQVQIAAVSEIVLASNTLKTALAANKAATVLTQTSATAFDAALESYKNGLMTITIVNETNNALLDARLAQTDAQAAALIAAANLAFFTGSLTSANSLPNYIQGNQ